MKSKAKYLTIPLCVIGYAVYMCGMPFFAVYFVTKWLYLMALRLNYKVSALLLLVLAGFAGFAEEATTNFNYVSDTKQVKAWKRTHIIGIEGGKVLDPTGTIADYQRGAALVASAKQQSTVMAGAMIGLNNALDEMYAVTNNIGNFIDRVYLAGDLMPDDTTKSNIWCYIVAHSYDVETQTDSFTMWYSEELSNAPKVCFRYRTELGTVDVEAAWEYQSAEAGWWTNHTYTVGGFEGCRIAKALRPSTVGNIVMRVNPYPRFGTPEGGFDFARKAFTVDDQLPFTGAFTNQEGMVETYYNGIFMGEESNEEDDEE